MKIVSFKICPFVQRVTALLEAKAVNYDIEYINLSDKPQWFMDISPNAQAPILITDDDQVLFESDAIVEYIDEAFGDPIFPRDLVKKAQDRAWSYLASKHYLVQCGTERSSDSETLQEKSSKLSTAFEKIAARLGENKFTNGDEIGMIDIAWIPILHRAAIIENYSGYDFLAEFPSLKRWQQALLSTGIPGKSVPEDFEEKFTAFYLSEKTYLGQLTKQKQGSACCAQPECTEADMTCCA